MKKTHLAIVDDDPSFVELFEEVATSFGYRVSCFTEAKKFLNSIDHDPPQLIALDIVMPDMDGIEVIQALSKRAEDFEVILCTGYNLEYLEIAEILSKRGRIRVRGRLQKPIRLNHIEKILQTPSG